MATALTLRSVHRRGSGDEHDFFDVVVGPFDDGGELGPHHRLVVVSVMRLQPLDGSARLVDLVGSRTTIAPRPSADGDGLAGFDGREWTVRLRCEFRARHANDGPVNAYLVDPAGAVIDLTVARPSPDPARTPQARPGSTAQTPQARSGSDAQTRLGSLGRSVLPAVRVARVAERPVSIGSGLHCATDPFGEVGVAWRSVAGLADRLGRPIADDRPSATEVRLDLVRTPGDVGVEGYRLRPDGDTITVQASTTAGLRHGLVTLAQLATASGELTDDVDDSPTWPMRVVHLDLARRWFEPDVVLRLLDLAAWRKFSHVHLHLTDDEAWRVPVASIPALAEHAGTRGPGLTVGPLCGSGTAPYGRAYTEAEIAEWVARADELGLELVPEIDAPGHCHAALAAIPLLRDPDARPGVASIQGFVDNVLVPGRPMTDRFVDEVFGTLADLFPNSPTLHVGGDEVPTDAWANSPAAQAFAAAHGATDHRSLHGAFVRSIVDRVRAATGRRVASWEEAAFSGGVSPDDGYVVAWTGVEAAQRLLADGFDVVASPAQAYYLDMATDRDWDEPGASWAGHTDLATTCDFDPSTLASESDGSLLGVQACLWAEHLDSIDTLDHLAFPRLDAIAESAWTGVEHDDDRSSRARHVATRSEHLPRFTN